MIGFTSNHGDDAQHHPHASNSIGFTAPQSPTTGAPGDLPRLAFVSLIVPSVLVGMPLPGRITREAWAAVIGDEPPRVTLERSITMLQTFYDALMAGRFDGRTLDQPVTFTARGIGGGEVLMRARGEEGDGRVWLTFSLAD